MDNRDKLARELFLQEFSPSGPCDAELETCMHLAAGFARVENVIAVLSDMRRDTSHIYAGRFARTLGLEVNTSGYRQPSIWEESLFSLVHPEDLSTKHLYELLFFHHVRHLPRAKRGDLYLMSRLRMKTPSHGFIPVLHRMFYVHDAEKDSVRLSLCLYGPLSVDFPGNCCAVNSVDGSREVLETEKTPAILSPRERQILELIARGYSSKEIAAILSISGNTVSRHRQEIISKLQVRNSVEACRVARDLKII